MNAAVDAPVPEPPVLQVGCVIAGKYRVDGLLGEGGMGLVFAGTHLLMDQRVAIKVVRAELSHNEEIVTRFANEARVCACLKGPNVARVLDVDRLPNGAPFMVMEYLEGSDLRQVLSRLGPLPVSTAAEYLLQACNALAEAHAAGIVHRDLKPENLFLTAGFDGSPLVKMLDFGIAKRIMPSAESRSYTRPSQGLGSPHYMAPEQIQRPGEVDARADVWSMGAVLYELLSGDAPFDGHSAGEICGRVLALEPPPLRSLRPDVPAELEQIVMCCLQKRRADRYASARELALALAHFVRPETAPASSPELAERVPSSTRRAETVISIRARLAPQTRVSIEEIPGFKPIRVRRAATFLVAAGAALYVQQSSGWPSFDDARAWGEKARAMGGFISSVPGRPSETKTQDLTPVQAPPAMDSARYGRAALTGQP